MRVTVVITDEETGYFSRQAILLCEMKNPHIANTFVVQLVDTGEKLDLFTWEFEVLAVDGYGETNR